MCGWGADRRLPTIPMLREYVVEAVLGTGTSPHVDDLLPQRMPALLHREAGFVYRRRREEGTASKRKDPDDSRSDCRAPRRRHADRRTSRQGAKRSCFLSRSVDSAAQPNSFTRAKLVKRATSGLVTILRGRSDHSTRHHMPIKQGRFYYEKPSLLRALDLANCRISFAMFQPRAWSLKLSVWCCWSRTLSC